MNVATKYQYSVVSPTQIVLAFSVGCWMLPLPLFRLPPVLAGEVGAVDTRALQPQVEAFCGNCHSAPRPDSFPKSAWPFEVARGFDFYYESFRQDLKPPPLEEVTAYYQSLAPESLTVPPPESNSESKNWLKLPPMSTSVPMVEPPAVSYITWQRLLNNENPQWIFADMRSGELRVVPNGASPDKSQLLATCMNPAHLEPCDLDGDGERELVVADLGGIRSGDHSRGSVIWLRRKGDVWKQRLLLSGVGRVADVQPGDFDGDGDSDLLVAEFGHFHTGSILLLENLGIQNGTPRFNKRVLDDRHGTIHIPVADLNADGHLDFVALVSQEFEVVDAFLNQGDGTFRRERVFSGNDPAFGSSGIQLVDLDADGDLDVLYSNGDTFGSEYIKPYHGIHWLENRGQYPFEDHFLAGMVGVQKALAGDLDGDGDQDIVGASLMPKNLLRDLQVRNHDSLIYLEQVQPGKFVRHSLEREHFIHAALEFADFDQDGDLDLAVGNMQPDEESPQPPLTIWLNQRLASPDRKSSGVDHEAKKVHSPPTGGKAAREPGN